MLNFSTDVNSFEFVSNCTHGEINGLIQELANQGHIQRNQLSRNSKYGVRKPNINDKIFWESLEQLKKCRDLLTLSEEEFINNLSKRLQHIR